MADTYKGACFCGAVEFEVTGAPAVAGYCHCTDCRVWAAAPINAFSLWAPDSVKITKGADNIATYNKTENSYRKFCKTCGGHLMTDHPGMKLVDVYASVLPDFPHKPTLHVFYASKMVSVKDGLPKFKDLPGDFGGSNEMLPD
ncbi:GFA family protein [Vineibacter terrae]|uniref:GFA family protein n=1 Tax=Vineibacter terrae TaxID=2586908 RepID=UPI002E2F6FF0|nr:GFA family protein [Vineibacter terrae]HEX2889115.1 GFA family protein [Vineibacter terrae]